MTVRSAHLAVAAKWAIEQLRCMRNQKILGEGGFLFGGGCLGFQGNRHGVF